jgi:hypothetical protein
MVGRPKAHADLSQETRPYEPFYDAISDDIYIWQMASIQIIEITGFDRNGYISYPGLAERTAMPKQKLEIECPICDAKISIDARSCPRCGADLGMADFQDLENLANDISGGSASYSVPSGNEATIVKEEGSATSEIDEEKVVIANQETAETLKSTSNPQVENTSPDKPKLEIKNDEDQADTGKKKGLFSKFFGKKK